MHLGTYKPRAKSAILDVFISDLIIGILSTYWDIYFYFDFCLVTSYNRSLNRYVTIELNRYYILGIPIKIDPKSAPYLRTYLPIYKMLCNRDTFLTHLHLYFALLALLEKYNYSDRTFLQSLPSCLSDFLR